MKEKRTRKLTVHLLSIYHLLEFKRRKHQRLKLQQKRQERSFRIQDYLLYVIETSKLNQRRNLLNFKQKIEIFVNKIWALF